MPIVYIPALLRDLTDGRDSLQVQGNSVAEVIAQLEAVYPGMRSRLCDDEKLRSGLAVAIDGKLATFGMNHPVDQQSEVHFVPAISGG